MNSRVVCLIVASTLFRRKGSGLIANPTNAHTNYLIKLLKSGRLSDLP